MFNIFLPLEVICILVLHQLFRLSTSHYTIKNLNDTIERVPGLKDGDWEKKKPKLFSTPGAFFPFGSDHANYHLKANTLNFHDVAHLRVRV